MEAEAEAAAAEAAEPDNLVSVSNLDDRFSGKDAKCDCLETRSLKKLLLEA